MTTKKKVEKVSKKKPNKLKDVEAILKVMNVLLERGSMTIFVTSDQQEAYQYTKAGAAFGVLFDCLWGEFRNKLKHGNPDKEYKTPTEAIEAYREYIGQLIEAAGIQLD